MKIEQLSLELGEVMKDSNPFGATVVYGGQAGSEGKGAVVGYLARRYPWGAAINTFMTNAGHTWLSDDGEKVVVQQLPMAVVSDSVGRLLIGPGAAITEQQLEREIEALDAKYNVAARLKIDPRAVIIEEHHRAEESRVLKRVASTMKGCGAALAAKALRREDVKLARDVKWLRQFMGDTAAIANDVVDSGKGLMIEASQGFDLDINHGIEYPYCTSRGTTPMQVCADIGVDGRLITRAIAVVRSYPIRVGNIVEQGEMVGFSGPMGGRETSFQALGVKEEVTTVTQRVRRVFEIDLERLGRMSTITRPTDIALTFADYVSEEAKGLRGDGRVQMPAALSRFIFDVQKAVRRRSFNPRISLVKTGPEDGAMIDTFNRHWSQIG